MARVVDCEVKLIGNVGNLNYSTMYDTNYVRTKNIPRNPKTAKQQAHRSDFGQFQNLGVTWLYGLINNYYKQGEQKKQPYRQFIKYNWAKWSKQRLAWWEAIPIFQFGNFCKNFTVSNGAETQITYTLDADMIEKVFETVPSNLKLTVIAIADFKKQEIQKKQNINLVKAGSNYTLSFTVPRAFYSYDDFLQDRKALLTNIFYESVDVESGQLKAYPFQNSINTYSSRELIMPDSKKDLIFDIDIIETEHGTLFTDKSYAKGGEEITISYFTDDGYILKSLVSENDVVSEDELMSGKFIMPYENVTLIPTFELGVPPIPPIEVVKITVYNNYTVDDDTIAFELYAPKNSDIVNPFKQIMPRTDYKPIALAESRDGTNIVWQATDATFTVGEDNIDVYVIWEYVQPIPPTPTVNKHKVIFIQNYTESDITRTVIKEYAEGEVMANLWDWSWIRTKYDLIGFNTAQSGRGTTYYTNRTDYVMGTEDLVLYAMWKKHSPLVQGLKTLKSNQSSASSGNELLGHVFRDSEGKRIYCKNYNRISNTEINGVMTNGTWEVSVNIKNALTFNVGEKDDAYWFGGFRNSDTDVQCYVSLSIYQTLTPTYTFSEPIDIGYMKPCCPETAISSADAIQVQLVGENFVSFTSQMGNKWYSLKSMIDRNL